MVVPSSASPERPRAAGRSIRVTFNAMVAVPVVCLVLLWALAAGLTLASALSGYGVSPQTHRALVISAAAVGAGLVVVLATVLLMGSYARRLSTDITGLAGTASRLAREQPRLVERLRSDEPAQQAGQQAGEEAVSSAAGASQSRHALPAELAQAAAAVASLQQTAVTAAGGEAGLRDGLRQVFVSLGRRNQSLLHRQLRLIDALEQKASNPAALADLFALDHLTTRMRRHAESLTILSGASAGRTWNEPVPVIDVIRGAIAEVEDYKRVTVRTRAEDTVKAAAVADMIHLLAELIENATLFSPSTTRVEVRAERVANGFAIEIEDRGLGIAPDQLSELNAQLAAPPDFDLADADRLGLFVGGRLAVRHGVRVSLRPSPYDGTTAIVLMPSSIVVAAAETSTETGVFQLDAGSAISRPAGLDLRGAEALSLTSQRTAQLSLSAAEEPAAASAGLVSIGQSSGGQSSIGQSSGGQSSIGQSSGGQSSGGQSGAGPLRGESAPGALRGEPGAGTLHGEPGTTTYRGLPRRTRQASLSPHLQDGLARRRTPGTGPVHAPVSAPAPEHARDLAASLQFGWQRSRQPDASDAYRGAGESASQSAAESERPNGEPPDSEARSGEET
jgi:signal transduction histidine kinase